MTTDPFERAARRERATLFARTGFRIHLAVYLGVQALLFVLWLAFHGGNEVVPWFVYPLLGWGIGLVAHYVAVRAAASAAKQRPQLL